MGTGDLHIVWGLVAPLVNDGSPKSVGVPSPYAVWGGGGGGGGGSGPLIVKDRIWPQC